MAQEVPGTPNKRQAGLVAIIIALIIFIVALIGLGAYYLWRQNNGDTTATITNTQQTANTTQEEDSTPGQEVATASDLRTFTGKTVNISFQYPASWGSATEGNYEGNGTMASGPFPGVTKGKVFSISFEKNPYVNISGGSKDLETSGLGETCPSLRGYKVATLKPADFTCSTANNDADFDVPTNCQDRKVASQTAYQYYYMPAVTNDEPRCATVQPLQEVAFMDLSQTNGAYNGIVFEMDLQDGMASQLQRLASQMDSASSESKSFLIDQADTVHKKLSGETKSGNFTDYVAQQMHDEFSALLASVKIQ